MKCTRILVQLHNVKPTVLGQLIAFPRRRCSFSASLRSLLLSQGRKKATWFPPRSSDLVEFGNVINLGPTSNVDQAGEVEEWQAKKPWQKQMMLVMMEMVILISLGFYRYSTSD